MFRIVAKKTSLTVHLTIILTVIISILMMACASAGDIDDKDGSSGTPDTGRPRTFFQDSSSSNQQTDAGVTVADAAPVDTSTDSIDAGSDTGIENTGKEGGGGMTQNLCGNGILDGQEECEGNQMGGASCQSLLGVGYTGTVRCDPVTCFYDISMCQNSAPTTPTTNPAMGMCGFPPYPGQI